jgi:DNA-binding transcriptional ArsR family regulator
MVTTRRDRHRDHQLDAIFGALADPTRRRILDRLTRGEATVGELAEPFDMTRPAISKHLDVLERAGLVHRIPDGRVNRCRFDGAPLSDAAALMERYRQYWNGELDALKTYLERETKR